MRGLVPEGGGLSLVFGSPFSKTALRFFPESVVFRAALWYTSFIVGILQTEPTGFVEACGLYHNIKGLV